MSNLASEFLRFFSAIESQLKTECNADSYTTFSRLLDLAIEKKTASRRVVARNSAELRQFANLRNLLSHGSGRSKGIAFPTDVCVERIKNLANQVCNSPKISSIIGRGVKVVSSTDRLSVAMRLMADHQFDQLPIWDNKLTGVITTSCISKWIGANLVAEEGLLVDDVTISTVTKSGGNGEFQVLRESCRVHEAIDCFESGMASGRPINSLIFNRSGSKKEFPQLIVTPADIPLLTSATKPA